MDKLDIILSKIDSLDRRIKKIEEQNIAIEKSCKGMDSHISFIDSIYMKLRAPLTWLTEKMYGSKGKLPSAKGSTEEDIYVISEDCDLLISL